jgi:hypothetical protein
MFLDSAGHITKNGLLFYFLVQTTKYISKCNIKLYQNQRLIGAYESLTDF